MNVRQVAMAGLAAAWVLAAGAASAATIVVNGTDEPWDPGVAGNAPFANGGATAPATIAVTGGQTVVIQYLSGLTSAFGANPPDKDAVGDTTSGFGSGAGVNNTGNSGGPFPSHAFTGDGGSTVYLEALIGDFVDSSGKVLLAFAPGDGAYTATAPAGTVALQFGLNDDIFIDNTGSLRVSVSGVPEPMTWAMMLLGFGGLGAMLRRRHRSLVTQ